LTEQFDEQDCFGILSMDVKQQNVLSMIHAAMAAEVEIILSQRSGIEGIKEYPYFQRHFQVIRHCLTWLNANGRSCWTSQEMSFLDIALVCMWDHLNHYQTISNLDDFIWVKQRIKNFRNRVSLQETFSV
jgi:hypothetical protein